MSQPLAPQLLDALPNRGRRLLAGALAAGAVVMVSACGADSGHRYSQAKLQQRMDQLEGAGLVIGEFALTPDPILDGDTVKVEGLDSTLRLLAIDTEETFKDDADRRDAESDFEAYLRDRGGDSDRPVKAATPMGEEAKRWAKEFFADVDSVRLERDHPKERRGRYRRYLAYVFANKGGEWINYNIECVRAGMSPYFTKYGYSRRFHDEFVAAEREAREAERGVWDPDGENYGDYPERTAWWDARAEFIKEFEERAAGREDFIALTNWDALRRLRARVGEEATVLGLVGEVYDGDRGPTRVLLSRQRNDDFPVIFFDREAFRSSGIAEYEGEFVTVTGPVSVYTNEARTHSELQIVIDAPEQVTGSKVPGLAPDATPTAMKTP